MKKYFIISLFAVALISFSTVNVMANSSSVNTEITEKEKKEKKSKKSSESSKETTKGKSCSGSEGKAGCCAGKKAS